MWHRSFLLENYSFFKDHGTVTFLLGLLMAVAFWYSLRSSNGRKNPPGPTGLPLFGYYPFLTKDPRKKLKEMAKKYGNVFSLYIGPQYLVVLNDWVALKDAYGQDSTLNRPSSLFANVPYNFGIVGDNGQRWVLTRRLSSRAMKDIGLNKAGWEDFIQEEVLELVNRIAKECGKPIDVRNMFSESFANNMVTLVLGERLYAGHPVTKELTKAVDAIMEFTPTLGMMNFSPNLRRLLQALGVEKEFLLVKRANDFGNFVSDTVDERIQNNTTVVEDSFIGRFQEEIRNSNSSYITEDSLKGNVIALLTGGSETTRTTIIWAIMAMADYPEKQRKVHEELDAVIGKEGSVRWADRFKVPYTYATLLESMRWRTVVPFGTMRIASEDMQIQGYHVPKGTFITFNNWAIHNDPNYWKNPEEFIPERFLLNDGKKVNISPESFNAFSFGKRGCPGKLIAQFVGLQYFVAIMQKFEVMPKRGEKVEYDTLLGLTYQATNVELRFIPR